ncbi:anthranilate phosphoribosyltransferase [Pseudoclavibacter sp. RFBJ3]|uniref:anthranilate phosphoribosyltransferase n=1 Tax=unclassified Pseudoclavibacter TaxID=2615177 RepID=UPI000CE74045|nr:MULTISPECIES: anthranilate phosphoribosyltransferase [unclassified Pseudoclavibacter]MBF4548964.1 anthranilate phosphoribosyltransferase [Pseudoclavibacter sp. VKM Ac-2888]PPF40252.1 anthranilate phosphoribosyltransferase [Pseudoclavibacter sp. AY1H1]PPF75743.1 anthranilate phosphoribosyltransferase [Pseudoclavibacter sp. Z016]PPF84347.1 anthranilate phosphoribosyltransferase [Pseudoclavibacter sp. RFBJ5]PPF92753.1 anthranilate phosphoribosyltransferase [Pseudoclavibacter sp. RFBJ3]
MTSTETWPGLLEKLLGGDDLSVAQATWAMRQVMSGDVSEARLAAFLVALRAKGETVEEVVGFRDAILEHAVPLEVPPLALDIVGTGGDMVGTVNVSTMASMVCAGAGVPVVKHGGGASSAKSGSSDVLSALGAVHTADPVRVGRIFEEVGLTFVYAAQFHPGFRHAKKVRGELGVPTVFNLLGPLTNPARPEASAVGVARQAAIPLITGVFRTRGATALVFRGDDGLDELSVTGYSHIWEVSNGAITEHDLHPRDVGLGTYDMQELLGGLPEENAAIARAVLSGKQHGAVRDIVLLNAAAGLVAYDLAVTPEAAERPLRERLAARIADAASSIDSGRAIETLDAWVAATRSA